MVRQLLLPSEGGGSLRRFLTIRQRIFQNQWNDTRPLRGPVSLFDFRRRDDAADIRDSLKPNRTRGLFAGWRVSDDSVLGGYSTSTMAFHEGVDKSTDESNNDSSSPSSASAPLSPPFVRWSGTLSTKINKQSHLARNITRSGFAAILSAEYPYCAPLGEKYGALELCCRTDGRTYAVNLHVATYFPEDMYQGFIVGEGGDQKQEETDNRLKYFAEDASVDITSLSDTRNENNNVPSPEGEELDVRKHLQNRRNLIRKTKISSDDHPYRGHPPAGFQKYVLRFKDFALTSRGRMRHSQRDLDGAINIDSIGFTLMDGEDGDFCFDLVSLRAVNVVDGEVVGTLEDEAREIEFENTLKSGGEKQHDDTMKEDGIDIEDKSGSKS